MSSIYREYGFSDAIFDAIRNLAGIMPPTIRSNTDAPSSPRHAFSRA